MVLNRLGTEERLLRHLILNNIRSYNKKYRDKYGEMILCMDHKSWRKDAFPHYKANRDTQRKESAIDWDDVWPRLNNIAEEVKSFLPYKVLHVPGAEGDDCIATMVKRTQQFGFEEPVMIIAADKDYIQLQKYPNVKQWSTVTKKMVKGDPEEWLWENVLKGQVKDGIPNIRMPADHLVNGTGKQKPITANFKLQAAELSGLTTLEVDRLRENYTLMDFDQIPTEISDAIISDCENYDTPHVKGMMNYLIKKRCANLLDSINDFTPGKYKRT